MTNAERSSGGVSRKAKRGGEAPVNVGRNYNGPKVAKFLVGQVPTCTNRVTIWALSRRGSRRSCYSGFQHVVPPTRLRLEFPRETGLILTCAGKLGNPLHPLIPLPVLKINLFEKKAKYLNYHLILHLLHLLT